VALIECPDLSGGQKDALRRLPRSDLTAATHFGLGLFVRNKLFYGEESCFGNLEEDARRQGRWCDPDGLSGEIIERAWVLLTGEAPAS
jgi:hypothetical protein